MKHLIPLCAALLAVCGFFAPRAQAQSLNAHVLGKGAAVGAVYEAYLSPHQEPGEEKDTPAAVPRQFQSTQPSRLRSERNSEGYARVSFSNDLSRAYVEVKMAGVDVSQINMFHIHCGRPDQLGPILVDFALVTDIQANLRDDGVFAVEITNQDILAVVEGGEGPIGAFTAGCPIVPGTGAKVQTVAGMEYIARLGDLYFNLHTQGQTYFGDIRGRIIEASPEARAEAREKLAAGLPPAPAPAGNGGHDH